MKNIKYTVIPKHVENMEIRRVGLIFEVFTEETIIFEPLPSNLNVKMFCSKREKLYCGKWRSPLIEI